MDFEANPKILKNKIKNQKATQYQSFNEALIDLQNDRIDGLLIDRVYANYYLQTEGILKDYNVFPVGFETESFAVGVRKADKTLKKKIDEAFVKLYQKGQFQKISKKWFGTQLYRFDHQVSRAWKRSLPKTRSAFVVRKERVGQKSVIR